MKGATAPAADFAFVLEGHGITQKAGTALCVRTGETAIAVGVEVGGLDGAFSLRLIDHVSRSL
jgi:hypothetical protein